MSKLLGFDYEFHYKSGAENIVADSLSKITRDNQIDVVDSTCASMDLTAISYPYFGWMDELRRYNESDKAKKVINSIAKGIVNPALAKYSIDDGFLYYKKRVVLSHSSQQRPKIMEEYNYTLMTGDQGIVKTYRRINEERY